MSSSKSAPARPPRAAPVLPAAASAPSPAAPKKTRRGGAGRKSAPSAPTAVFPSLAGPTTRAETAAVTALVATLDTLNLEDRLRFRAIVGLLYKEGERLGISSAQLHNGGISEVLVSQERGHTLATSIQGSDSFTVDGKGVEQKNAQPALIYNTQGVQTGVRRNFNYVQPKRGAKELDDEAYLGRIHAHWLKKAAGGHFLTPVDGENVGESYVLDAGFMAAYFREHTRRAIVGKPFKHVKHNLGCEDCASCGRLHRILWLVERAEAWLANGTTWTSGDWDALFASRIKSDCGVAPTSS